MDMKTKNKFVSHYFKMGLLRCSKVSVVITILHLISFPLTIGLDTAYLATKSDTLLNIAEIFLVLSFMFSGVAVLAGVLIAMTQFSYLHKKYETDTYMSLPLSDKQRFMCDYFSGLLSYIVPVIISQILTYLISFGAMYFDSDLKKLSESFDISFATAILQCFAIAIVVMIMFYTITAVACVICGSIFETLSLTVLLNIAIPGIIYLLFFIAFNKVEGVTFIDMLMPLLSKTSPIGALVGLAYHTDKIGDDFFRLLFFSKYLLWILFFSAVYFFVALFLFKKRKAESVSKPYVFKGFYYAIMSCITFGICAIIPISFEELIIPMIIFATVVYLIFEVITNRGFKNFKYSILKNFVTIGACILVIVLLNNPWGFGMGKKIPKLENIQSAKINYVSSTSNNTDYYLLSDNMKYTDKEAIEIIYNAHKKYIEKSSLKNAFANYSLDYDLGYSEIHYYDKVKRAYQIEYTLKNGSTMCREFYFNSDEILELTKLENTQEYADNIADCLEDICKQGDTFRFYTKDFSYEIQGFEYDKIHDVYYSNSLYNKFMLEMCNAIKADIPNRDYSQIINPTELYGWIDIEYNEFYVYNTDTNIIRVIETYKDFMGLNVMDFDCPFIITKDNLVKNNQNLGCINYTPNCQHYSFDNEQESAIQDDLNKLVTVSKPYTYDEKDEYVLHIYNGNSHIFWYIPYEYNDLAQKVFDYAKAQEEYTYD